MFFESPQQFRCKAVERDREFVSANERIKQINNFMSFCSQTSNYCHGGERPSSPMTTADLVVTPTSAPRKIYNKQQAKSSHVFAQNSTNQPSTLTRQQPVTPVDRQRLSKYLMNRQIIISKLSGNYNKVENNNNNNAQQASDETNDSSSDDDDTEDSTDNKLDKPKVSA